MTRDVLAKLLKAAAAKAGSTTYTRTPYAMPVAMRSP
jgi:hypothetical protein